ncbi:TIGR02611 family protein [Dermacoccus abyssi]|uniref:TIGR02611 family protein n=1 Tax=Dermacoccus abyssi TaxID=322596 RepID=UPI002AD41BF3|nr:TIGR02611 family protein [Dermacoccus abyssi]
MHEEQAHGATPVDGGDRDRWEWRRRIRANPRSAQIYRMAVAIFGLIVVLIGIILLPFPGPGWVIIFIGLGIWGSEFEWAQNLLKWVRGTVEAWWDWLEKKGLWAKAIAGLLTFALVLAIFWAMFAVSGVPGWFPDFAKDLLAKVPGLG